MAPVLSIAFRFAARPAGRCALLAGWLACGPGAARAQEAGAPATLYLREFRVVGARELPRVEVGEIVYPFLGPGRTEADVEGARAALEKAYQEKGFQGASVQVPPQQGRGGVVFLQVSAGRVSQLRVKGSRFLVPSRLKARAQSLAEGRALNFNDVSHDLLAMNQWPDRQITPELRPGETPGTVEVDLRVKDQFPLHGSVELNNRYNANTTPLRLTISANYNNLWQLGHTLGATYQVAPQRREDAEIISGYYIARFPRAENFSLMLQGRRQNSDIVYQQRGDLSLAGSNNVVAPGESAGVRGIWTLPPLQDFYHSVTVGVDYSHFENNVTLTGRNGVLFSSSTPFTYFPVSALYSATLATKERTTELNAGLTFGLRGPGSDREELANSRFGADANFFRIRGDLAHTQALPGRLEGFARVEGQLSSRPLVNTEQIAGGGLQSIRGYLEGEVLADNGVLGTIELRSPSLLGPGRRSGRESEGNEWRVYLFGDAGLFTLRSPLPEQEDHFTLASVGVGTRLRLLGHFNGSVDAALPLTTQGQTDAGETRVTFRVWADF